MSETTKKTALENKREATDFSKGSIPRAILRLALPMTLAQFTNILYNIIDRIYLGRLPGVGHYALTGVGLAMPVILLSSSFAFLCGMGGGPLFAIARGKGDNDEAERLMGNTFTLLLFFGVVMTVVLIIFRQPILFLFGASDITYLFAGDYLLFTAFGTIFKMIVLGMNGFITGQGYGKIAMMTVSLGAIINIILDPIFIFALGMGVRGAGLATAISQFCSALWVMGFLTNYKTPLRLKFRNMRLKLKRVVRIFTLGLSGFFMSATTSAALIVTNVTLQQHGGDLYVGVMAIVGTVREILFMPMHGISSGAGPVIGFNYGAGEIARMRKGIVFTVVSAFSYAMLLWLFVMLAPGFLIRIFTNDAVLVETAIPAMRMFFVLFMFMSLQMSSQTVFTALGMAKYAIFFALLRKVLVVIPLTIALPMLGLGTDGVFIAEPISHFIGGLACITTMYIVVYRRFVTQDS